MGHTVKAHTTRPRISIDVEPEFRRQIRLAAAERDVTVRQYVVEAIEARLQQDATQTVLEPSVLTSATDPVLADLWDNDRDAAYDRL